MLKKILMVTALLVLGAAAPASAQYPEIVVTPGTVIEGGTISVTGQFCNPGENVVITLRPAATGDRAIPAEGIVVVTTVADEDGAFNTSFDLPPEATPGSYEVVVNCGGTIRTEIIEVLGQSVNPPSTVPGTTPVTTPGPSGNNGNNGSGTLPRTGSDLNGYGLIGAGLLTVGGLFLLGARKRRTTAV